MSALPPIPKNWTVGQMEDELKRAEDYAQRHALSHPLTADFYERQAEQLREAIKERRKSAGMSPAPTGAVS